jgi:dienelactone hydrolase
MRFSSLLTAERSFMRIINPLLLLALLFTLPANAYERVTFKWNGDYAHNSARTWSKDNPYASGWSRNFQNGAPEEFSKVEKDGMLDALLFVPKGAKTPMPFVVLMHPCGGLDGFNTAWVEAVAEKLNAEGIGVIAPDSYKTRNMAIKCGYANGLHWGFRRGEDAYAALDYLLKEHLALADKAYVMGYSNGGLATLVAMSNKMKDHPNKFAGGFAIVPYCGLPETKKDTYYNPVMVFSGTADTQTPSKLCEELSWKKRSTPVQFVILKDANHGFMFNRAPAVVQGVKYSYDAAATQATLETVFRSIKATTPTAGSHENR